MLPVAHAMRFRWNLILLLVGPFAALGFVLLRWGFLRASSLAGPDDAYISYRYAWNLAHGNGFVFNPGDAPIQGTSTPLYTGMLAIFGLVGVDIPTAGYYIGAFGVAVSMCLLFQIGRQLKQPGAGLAAALVWGTSPFTRDYMLGMETPIYIVLILGSFLALTADRRCAALTLAGLAVLTRLDAFAFLASMLVYLIWTRRLDWRQVLPSFVLISAWLVFATFYFGSPVPESAAAKSAVGAGLFGPFSPFSNMLMHLIVPATALSVSADAALFTVGILALPFALYALQRRIPKTRLLILWLVFYVGGFVVLNLPNVPWYYGPPAVVGSLLVWLQIDHLLKPLPFRLRAGSLALIGGAALIILVLPVASVKSGCGPLAVPECEERPPWFQAGLWLKANAPHDSTVAAYDVGMIGYASNLRVIDLVGLTEPRALAFLEQHDYAWAIRETKPDYVFTDELSDWPITNAIFAMPQFRENYTLVARFPHRRNMDFLLYRRNNARMH